MDKAFFKFRFGEHGKVLMSSPIAWQMHHPYIEVWLERLALQSCHSEGKRWKLERWLLLWHSHDSTCQTEFFSSWSQNFQWISAHETLSRSFLSFKGFQVCQVKTNKCVKTSMWWIWSGCRRSSFHGKLKWNEA
jgi:hypothetical protein